MSAFKHFIRPLLALADVASQLSMMILAWSAALRFGWSNPIVYPIAAMVFLRWLELELIATNIKPWQWIDWHRRRREEIEGLGE